MQKDQHERVGAESERQTFSPFVKNQALKILSDYVLSTGRKWQSIRSEIVKVTGIEVSDRAPMITRQDLESWAARKSTLGDGKFRLVFEYLTHPETLARPEFSKALDLMSFGAIERIGRTIADIYDDHKKSYYVGGSSQDKENPSEYIEQKMIEFQGCFTGFDQNHKYCLSLSKFQHYPFFVCHFFWWPNQKHGESYDWNIERYSGICTIGNKIRILAKGITLPEPREMFLVPIRTETTLDYNNAHIILLDSFTSSTLGKIRHLSMMKKKIDISVDLGEHCLVLQRTYDLNLLNLIDKFQWNIAL